jgi:hypothetical protein
VGELSSVEDELLADSIKELKDVTTFEERLSLIFVVDEIKPGAVVMGVEKNDREKLEEFAEKLDLSIRFSEGSDRSLFDRLLGRDTRMFKDTAFICRDEEHFQILEEADPGFAGYTDESVGRFLGYPQTAIEHYSDDETPGADFGEMIDASDRDDLEYLNFLSYVPAPQEERVDEAVEEGRERAQKLEELSEYHSLFREYREKALERDT